MISLIKSIRIFLYKNVFWSKYQIGKRFHCGLRVRLWANNTLKIGDDFYIGHDSFIQTNCIVGNWVMFGNKVAVVGKYDHHFQQIGCPIRLASQIRDSDYYWKGRNLITFIGDDVWIGYGVTIMGGVKIGDGCIVAAGSVVTSDLDPYCIYGGNPARKIKPRFESPHDEKLHKEILNKIV
jgi:acetyltransferase-like isoleucine patch superfamily enzyme